MGVTRKVLRLASRLLPARVRATADYHLRPHLLASWGGPLNGQRFRMHMVLEMQHALQFQAVVETGTFRGTSTEFFSGVSNGDVVTIEANPEFYFYASKRLRGFENVKIRRGSSPVVLRELAEEGELPFSNVLFYLDAHWQEYLPLLDELRVIGEYWSNSVIMIDDFQVPDDEGYQFDDYGEGKRLSLEFLEGLDGAEYRSFFPSASSDKESGKKRGSIVLAPVELEATLAECITLRPGPYIGK